MFVLRVESEVRPTEDKNKVLRAVTNFFDVESYRIIESAPYSLMLCESRKVESLLKLYTSLRVERILDSARKIFEKGKYGNKLIFKLHKQSAYAGHISFVTIDSESPLGPIKVIITSDKIDELIDWLAPKTLHGKPLWEKNIPS